MIPSGFVGLRPGSAVSMAALLVTAAGMTTAFAGDRADEAPPPVAFAFPIEPTGSGLDSPIALPVDEPLPLEVFLAPSFDEAGVPALPSWDHVGAPSRPEPSLATARIIVPDPTITPLYALLPLLLCRRPSKHRFGRDAPRRAPEGDAPATPAASAASGGSDDAARVAVLGQGGRRRAA